MKWLVVQTKVNCEHKAQSNLVRQGYLCFLPKILKVSTKFNRIKKITKPLFPGYIFVNLKSKQSWFKIDYTFGVRKIMKINEKLCYIPNSIFNEIKNKCDSNGFFSEFKTLKSGDNIKFIKSNNFAFDAEFLELIDSKRSFVLLDILKRKIKVKINNYQILF